MVKPIRKNHHPELTVYIPTRGRIGEDKQVTLKQFMEYSKTVPVLVCPREEVRKHRAYHSSVLSCPEEGIGNTRQWIVEESPSRIVVMMDDDMTFAYRPDPNKTQLQPCTNLTPLLKEIEALVEEGYIHGGVGARQGNNRKEVKGNETFINDRGHLIRRCERVNNAHFVDREAVLKTPGKFNALRVMEDFHFTLTLLTEGLENAIIHDIVWNQKGSGAEGGCSLYRTAEVQAQGAEGLRDAFPDFVRVVEKESKSVWEGMTTRKDVIVQWIKAARHGGIDI